MLEMALVVEIGAFPFRPNDNENRKLLEGFIRELIETKAKDTVQHVIPQKGTVMEVDNRVLVGVVRPSHRRGYEKSLKRHYSPMQQNRKVS